MTDGAGAATDLPESKSRFRRIEEERAMLIDCDTCTVRGVACSHCLVSTLFEPRRADGGLTADEQHAIEVFALAGFEVEVIEEPAAPARLPSRASRPRRRRLSA